MKHTPFHYRPLKILALPIVAAILLTGLPAAAQAPAGKSFPPSEGTTWGHPQDLGDDQIQTFVTLDSSGNPNLIGVYFSEAALAGLPETVSDGRWDVLDADGNVVIPCCGHEVMLELPESAAVTPFRHVVINWNPMGHQPAGIYDAPHFDFHFYTIANEDRMTLTAATAETMCSVPNPPDIGGEHPVAVSCETFDEAMIPLPDDQMPPGYFSGGAVEPGMGNHLGNTQAAELHGEPFTHTWIYGAYAGRLTFFEPMITLAYLLEQNEEACSEIAMPEAMPEAGYYPTQYCIRYLSSEADGEGAYTVSLESFVEF